MSTHRAAPDARDVERLARIFAPTAAEASDPRCDAIRVATHAAACALVANAPRCADLTSAIRELRRAMRSAQDAVLLNGEV